MVAPGDSAAKNPSRSPAPGRRGLSGDGLDERPYRGVGELIDRDRHSVEMFGSAWTLSGTIIRKCLLGSATRLDDPLRLGRPDRSPAARPRSGRAGPGRRAALGVELAQVHLRPLAEPALDRLGVEVPLRVDPAVDAAAGHPGAGPRADVAEHDRAARGHVLEREALGVGAVRDAALGVVERLGGLAAEDDVGAREADAEARVGRALDEQAAALGPVGERLADRAVDPLAVGALALEDRDLAAEHALADAVLGAALDPDVEPVGVKRAEALAGDRAAVELERGEHVAGVVGKLAVDPPAGDRAGEVGAEHAVVGVGGARELER